MGLLTKNDLSNQLWNARIGYGNLLTSAIVPAAESALTSTTYDRYTSTGTTMSIRYLLSSNAIINFIGLAAHNFGTHDGGVGVEFFYSTTISGPQTPIEYVLPTDNSPIMITFDDLDVAEVILKFTSLTIGVEFGVVSAGVSLEMQRPIYGGHSPIDLSAKTKYQSSRSESGNILGRSIIRLGLESSFEWKNLDPDWYRTNFKPFQIAARTAPFFIMWRPDLYSNEVAYGETTGDIKPQNQGGGNGLMSVSFNMSAHSDI